MRPIDADTLKPDYIIPSSSTNTLCTRLVSLQQILTAPTIDAVTVVRCKDCRCWDRTWEYVAAPEYHYCMMVDGARKGDFYCADGERRKE